MSDPRGDCCAPIGDGEGQRLSKTFDLFRCTWARFPPDADLEAYPLHLSVMDVILEGDFKRRGSNPVAGKHSSEFGPGTVLMEPPGQTLRDQTGAEGALVIRIAVEPYELDPVLEPLVSFLHDRSHHFRRGKIVLLALRLAREIRRPGSLARPAVRSAGLEMLIDAARSSERRRGADELPDWLLMAEEYVRENFRTVPEIAQVAGAVGASEDRLGRLFSAVHGVPLGTFIRRLRLEWVAARLERTSEPVSSIARAAGYCDQPHLTRAFKAYIGETPGAYRRKTVVHVLP